MRDVVTVTVELPAAHAAWLEGMAAEHALPDAGKAFRCALMFVIGRGTALGRERAASAETARAPLALQLAPQQLAWVEAEARRACGGVDASHVAAAVCDACMAADSAEVFGVIRCKTGAAAAPDGGACEGARAALRAQRERQAE